MKLSANILILFLLLFAQVCHSAERKSIVIDQLLAFYNKYADSSWSYIQNPPAQLVESAQIEYDSYVDSMKETNPALTTLKLEEESTADLYDIVVIYSRELDFYKVAWMYLWENLDCGGYYFHADTFTFTESWKRVIDGVVPSIRSGRTVCVD